ncbi:MAG TPA: carbon monoxide dehydrogenase subunit G [Rhizomicrobium sp.]|nr:carbon monoxide dehydrogenase subunit G [Rhizomicrobium sp.]
MNFTGTYAIPAPVDSVWEALNDPEILKACIPGCEQLDKTSATDFTATATLRIGPVKATFRGKVKLSDLDPPYRCKLSGEGQGGVAGFAKGNADVALASEGGGTVLTYEATASVGGKLAQIGQRLIDGAAKQIADDFFGRFSATLAAAHAPVLEPDPEVEASSLVPVAVEAQRRDGVAPEIWIVGLVGVVVILLVILGMVL